MTWHSLAQWRWTWRRPRASAWGAVLGRHEITLAALSLQKTGGLRVVRYTHQRAPAEHPSTPGADSWLLPLLQTLGGAQPARARALVLALDDSRCRQGRLDWDGPADLRRLQGEVQLEAAAAWAVSPQAVGFDFRLEPVARLHGQALHGVQWAACLRDELQQWQALARQTGWRLHMVETATQALQRARMHLRGQAHTHGTLSPRDWQFDLTPPAATPPPDAADMPDPSDPPGQRSLAACGAALAAWL